MKERQFILMIIISFLFQFCSISHDYPAQVENLSEESALAGNPLALARISQLFENIDFVEGAEAEELFISSIQSYQNNNFGTKMALIELDGVNSIKLITRDSLFHIFAVDSMETINCVRTYNGVEEYRSFEVTFSPSPQYNFSTAFLTLYSYRINQNSVEFFTAFFSDTSLFIHDLYENNISLSKIGYNHDGLTLPWYGGDNISETCYAPFLFQAYYNSIKSAITMTFVGKHYLEFLSNEMLGEIASALNMSISDVAEHIGELVDEVGFNIFVTEYLSHILIDGGRLFRLFSMYETYSDLMHATMAIFDETADYNNCTSIDIRFMSLWCDNINNFPYEYAIEEDLKAVCRQWASECSQFDDNLFIQTTFAMNFNNRSILCNECRYEQATL